MTINDIVNLIGLKSTHQDITAWFQQYQLAKAPKTVNVNQDMKSIKDIDRGLEYFFGFDIKHDAFYPPYSPKNDDYTFDCFLVGVSVFNLRKKSKQIIDDSFWQDHIHPGSTYEECYSYFQGQVEFSQYDICFRKMINDLVEINVKMKPDKSQITYIELGIGEAIEFFSAYDFDTDNEYNTIKQAYLLVVKWLFDQRYLLLDEEVYAKGLSYDTHEIQHFLAENLHNHIWDVQLDLSQEPKLYAFLCRLESQSYEKLLVDNQLDMYIKHLFLKQAGVWQEHQQLYNKIGDRDFQKIQELEESVFLNLEQSKSFVNNLTDLYGRYKDITN